MEENGSRTDASARAPAGRRRFGNWRRWLPALALVAAVAFNVGVTLRWIAEDQSVGPMLEASCLTHVTKLVRAHHEGHLHKQLLDFKPGLMAWAGLGGRLALGDHPDVLLWIVLAFLVATQLLLYDVGHQLHGALAGILAAALLPLLPDVAWMARRWAPMVFHFFFLAAAASCLIRSRSFSRPLPSLGFALAVGMGAFASVMITNNVCFLSAALGMAAASLGRGLITGRGPRADQTVPRWRVALFGLLAAGAVTGIVVGGGLMLEARESLGRAGGDPTYEQYVSRWSWRALTAYSRHLVVTSVSPVLAVALLVALVPFLRRGTGRAELLGWLLFPLLAFSLINKKNTYYLYPILPAVPLIIGMGFAALRARRVQIALIAITLIIGGAQLVARGGRGGGGPVPKVLGEALVIPDITRVFEQRAVPSLLPQPRFEAARHLALLRERLATGTCPTPERVLLLGRDPGADAVEYLLTTQNPCASVEARLPGDGHRPGARPGQPAWILVEDPGREGRAPPGMRTERISELLELLEGTPGIERVDGDRRRPSLWLYRVDPHARLPDALR